MKKMTVRSIAVAAMLSAVAFVLMFIEFPVPIMPAFIKFDISDLPALVGAFSLGPVYGVVIELIKNLLHGVIKGTTSAWIGELSNFTLGTVMCLAAGFIYKAKKTRVNAIVASIVGAVAMGVISLAVNYFVIYPMYFFLAGFPKDMVIGMYQAILGSIAEIPTGNALFNCLLVFNVPFTIVKGLVDALICCFIYKPLSRLINKQ